VCLCQVCVVWLVCENVLCEAWFVGHCSRSASSRCDRLLSCGDGEDTKLCVVC
jgi:hypothetical protein